MNENLLPPFMAEDVKKAAFSIRDLKPTSPDGLHAIFYPKNGTYVVQILHTRFFKL
jgi:hypothetical protein